MPFLIPRHTRIILIPDDDRPSREYGIGRGLLFLLGALLLLLAAVIVAVLVSFGGIMRETNRIARLESDLELANRRLAAVQVLNDELEQMRSLQERVLFMLGVEPTPLADMDTLAGGAGLPAPVGSEPLGRVATLVMTPPPDLWPVAGFVTREFSAGDQARRIAPHHGIDLAAALDKPIRAAGKGLVMEAGWDEFLGNFVEIQHGFGYVTVYGHCSRIAVRKGDRIDRGQVIAYLGGTGEASAPHLHFEIWKEGEVVDPRSVLPGGPPR